MTKAAEQGVAIVGLAAAFPGAEDAASFWRNIEAGTDAVREAPPSRWDPQYFDPASTAPDRVYCRRGGFLPDDLDFDALGFGIMPVAAQGAEPDQLLALRVAAAALGDAGGASFDRSRAGVVIGRGGYLTPGIARLDQYVRTAEQLVVALRELVPGIGDDVLGQVKTAFQERVGRPSPEASIGLVPNLAASRVANRLDFGGPAYTVDAACASSLVAIDHACRELTTGRCDLVLAGGLHVCHDITFWSVFCQLGALSRSETIRPFDRRADGLVIGEGGGVVVLKRLADAMRSGDRIYAVIRGTGVSSDGRGASLMNPRVDGQVLAVRRAWEAAGLDPASVGLLEAHGTGTPTGDAAELDTLATVFGPAESASRAVLGSVKSMIGHTMPAAGIAGLIKAALAIHHEVLPPTLHCEEPRPAIAERTRFRTIARAEPWTGHGARRAGINAFGFGGINAHVVLESAPESLRRRAARVPSGERLRAFIAAAADPGALADALEAGRAGGSGPCRAALLDPTQERRERAAKLVRRGKPWRGRKDMWFTPGGLLDAGAGKVAFVFPGVEAVFDLRIDDVAAHFGLDSRRELGGSELEQRGFGIVHTGRVLNHALRELGVHADMVCGHSLGEWTGMLASGILSEAGVDSFLASAAPGSLDVPDVAFAALGCGAHVAAEIIADLDDIAVSHDNCPHQSVLCGREEPIRIAVERLRERGVLGQVLPFRSGFHSPLFADYVAPHRRNFASLDIAAPTIPMWSATTCEPYPADPDAVRELAIRHLLAPVRFRELVERLYDEGARVFVQLGAGSPVGFIGDTLRSQDHLAVAANSTKRSGMAELIRCALALHVEGAAIDLDRLPVDTGSDRAGGGRRAAPAVKLRLGSPLVSLAGVPPLAPASRQAPPRIPGAIGEAMQGVLDAVLDAGTEIAAAFEHAPAPTAPRTTTPAPRTTEPAPRATAPGGPAPHRAEPPATAPRSQRVTHRMSSAALPFLRDHSFYRQPENWPHPQDFFPVVPMTMLLDLMIDTAAAMMPGKVAVALEEIRALRWLAVEPPVDVAIDARPDGADRVRVVVEGYAAGVVRFASDYPPAPAPALAPLTRGRAPDITAEQLYADRWMFHGPAYQCVTSLDEIGDDGIVGMLEAKPAPGALLDNAGQLLGYWMMQAVELDKLAFPISIESIELFGPRLNQHEQVRCSVRIRRVTDTMVRSDMELMLGDAVWARIRSWDDRRFDTDGPLWRLLRYPERNSLTTTQDGDTRGGWSLATEHWKTAASRELIARRYLDADERAAMEALGPRRRRGWLLGRIAVKDAVRDHLWQRGHGALFPIEIRVSNDELGRPRIEQPSARDLRVSLAHKDGLAVAVVGEGKDVGIDLERIEPRTGSFIDLAFGADELALGDRGDAVWLTRLWAAKEALAKACGRGLEGNPKRMQVLDAEGDRLLVRHRDLGVTAWVDTSRHESYVVAWCEVGEQ